MCIVIDIYTILALGTDNLVHFSAVFVPVAGDLDRAAEAIGAFLLFNSSHPDMVRNRLFFISRLGYHDSHLRARKVSNL